MRSRAIPSAMGHSVHHRWLEASVGLRRWVVTPVPKRTGGLSLRPRAPGSETSRCGLSGVSAVDCGAWVSRLATFRASVSQRSRTCVALTSAYVPERDGSQPGSPPKSRPQ